MLTLAVPAAILLFVAALALSVWRLVKGPRPADRVLALDSLTTCLMALGLLGGLMLKTDAMIEVALLLALLGFAATIALSLALGGGPVPPGGEEG